MALAMVADETQCGDPEQPISSIVNRTSVNTVEYSCAKGYKMDGNPTRSCLGNGVWSGHPPRCSGAWWNIFLPLSSYLQKGGSTLSPRCLSFCHSHLPDTETFLLHFIGQTFFYLCHCRSFPFHLFHSSWLKFIVVCTIVYACSLVNYWSISTLFRGPMRGPFERQGWIHRSVQLQREIRVRILGHLSLQSRFHFVGQCLEALLWRRGVDWNKAPLQAN